MYNISPLIIIISIFYKWQLFLAQLIIFHNLENV